MENNKEGNILRPNFSSEVTEENIKPFPNQEEDLVVGQNKELEKYGTIHTSKGEKHFNLDKDKEKITEEGKVLPFIKRVKLA